MSPEEHADGAGAGASPRPGAAPDEAGAPVSTTAYVCVHGIGVHRAGALAQQTRDSVRRGAEAAGGTLTDLPLDADAPDELRHRARVEVPGREPILAEFHDGWWDSGTRTPPFWTVLLWMLEVAPFALISGVGGWCGDRWREASDVPGPHRGLRPRTAARRIAALVTSAAMLLVVPLLVLVLLIGLPLAGLVPAWRRRLHPVMVEVIGDAWLYRSSALDRTVLPRLCRIVAAASERADRVVLVGHSQGAELSRRVALQAAPESCVWVGSGEHQLNTVRVVAATSWLPLLVWPFVLAWPGFLHLMLTHAFAAVVVLPAALLYGLLTAVVVRWLRHRPADVGQVPDSRIWHVKSLGDPVSWGTVFPSRADGETTADDAEQDADPHADQDRGTVRVRYVPAHPDRPWWAEHVTYFSRPRTGAVILEAGLDSPAPLLPAHRARVPGPWVVLAAVGGAAALWVSAVLGGWQLQLLP